MERDVETSEREGRRRRIVERGSDRMALITGRVKTLDSSSLPSSSSSTHHSHTQSSPVLFFQNQPPPNLDVNDGFSRATTFDFGSRVEPQLHKCESETHTKAIRAPSMEVEDMLQPSLATARVPKASNDAETSTKSYGIYLNFYTAKEISSCIIASENTRVLCSIVIALLVVLSNISLPRSMVKSESIIASRPLYVLLTTDVAIVIALLTLKRRVSEKAKEEEETGRHQDGHNWAGAVRVLELGLVVHQTIRAIFIDCSFYAVIVICGLSLL